MSALEGLPGNLQPIFRCTAHSQLISTPLVFDFPAGNLLADVIIGRAAKVTIDSSRKIIAAVSWRSPAQPSGVFAALRLSPDTGGRNTPGVLLRPPSAAGKAVAFVGIFPSGLKKREKLRTPRLSLFSVFP